MKKRNLILVALVMPLVLVWCQKKTPAETEAASKVASFETTRALAEKGDATAQSNLGYMYYKGTGVAENDVQAYKWWNLAAAQGDADAKKNKEIIESRMTREQIAEAQKLSAEWKPKK